MTTVALCGIGIMGNGMARNMHQAGFDLRVYNRTRAKAEPLAELGAVIADTPREAAAGADVVISMVGDDTASRQIWLGEDGALAGAKPGAVLVECSTLSPEWVKELASQATAQGLSFLNSPVTGSKDAAEGGTLGLMVGGEVATLAEVRPVLESFSQRITHMGPTGSGATMKLINNLMGAIQAAALAEGLALAERAGLNMEKVAPLIINGSPGSPLVKGKAARMVHHDYSDTQFALRWMHKDVSYALAAAAQLGIPMATLDAARSVYEQALAKGHQDDDFAAVIEALR